MLKNIIPNENITKIDEVIKNNEKFVILTHKNPDGDAIGSTTALAQWLSARGKKATIITPNEFPEFLQWIPFAENIIVYDRNKVNGDKALAEADALFCLDCNSLTRTGDVGETARGKEMTKILIDHHLDPDNDFDIAVSHHEVCATSELIFLLLHAINPEILDSKIAESIYTGMMTDTGSFAYASNRAEIYIIISHLIATGIDKDRIYRKVFYNYSLDRLRLMGYIMNCNLKLYKKSNAALITLRNEELMQFNARKGDTEGLVNMPLQIKGVRFSCFLREETPGKINVSLRSVDDFPCNEVAAKYFGGGGHKNASGGEVHGNMEQAITLFEKALNSFRKELTT